MKKVLLALSCLFLFGCSSFDAKKTDFYKNGRLVKSCVGKGIFDGDDWTGVYKVWKLNGNGYYQYKCIDCDIVETVLTKK